MLQKHASAIKKIRSLGFRNLTQQKLENKKVRCMMSEYRIFNMQFQYNNVQHLIR